MYKLLQFLTNTKTMMIKTLIVFILLCASTKAEKPVTKWANSATGNYSDNISKSITVDENHNVYVTGYFFGPTIQFGSFTLTNSKSGSPHVFIVKYDSSGNVLWARSSGITESGYALSITSDAIGNIFVSGFFKGNTISFGSITLNNENGGLYGRLFIVKYDTLGNVMWAETSSNTTWSNAMYALCADNLGNVYATGHFQDNSITFGNITLNNSEPTTQDIFLVKYNSSGTVIWAKSIGGNNHDVGNSVCVDGSGNVILTGNFSSPTITVGTTTITNKSPGSPDIFIAKYDAQGTFLWAKSASGTGTDIGSTVTTDQLGDICVGGCFSSNLISFGNITLTNENSGFTKNFIVKYDTNGKVLWAKSGLNGTLNDEVKSLSSDKVGNLYATGYFESPTITFDNTTLTNSSSQTQDIFITKYNSLGKVLWAKNFGGKLNDSGNAITSDLFGNVYLTGQYISPNMEFDAIKLPNTVGSFDVFVAKIESKIEIDSIQVNYCSSEKTITLSAYDGYSTYSWTDSKGNIVGSEKDLTINQPSDGANFTCNMTATTNVIDQLNVTIIKFEPKANFSFQNNCTSNTIQFTNLSSTNHGTLTYKWDFGDGSSNEENPKHTFTNSGLHFVSLEITNSTSLCKNIISYTVETFSSSFVGMEGDLTYCQGYSTTIKAYGAYRYEWNNKSTSNSIEVSKSGQIWLIGYSSTGCVSDTIFKTITKEPDWILSIAGNSYICANDSSQLKASGAKNYSWNTNQSDSVIFVKSPGKYTVSGWNSRGCKLTKSITVVKDVEPTVNFKISTIAVSSRYNEINCIIPLSDSVVYTWEMGDGQIEYGNDIHHTYSISKSIFEYKITLKATTKNGCVYIKSKILEVIPFIPNVFTPNGDNINALFMPDVFLQIVDRYGIVLYKGISGWDGSYKGQNVKPDTYFYLIDYPAKNQTTKTLKGYITIIR